MRFIIVIITLACFATMAWMGYGQAVLSFDVQKLRYYENKIQFCLWDTLYIQLYSPGEELTCADNSAPNCSDGSAPMQATQDRFFGKLFKVFKCAIHKCWKNQDNNQDDNRNMNNRALTCPDGEKPSNCADGSTPVQRNEQIKGDHRANR